MVRININEFVKVKLTPQGKVILNTTTPSVAFDFDACNNEYRLQLWELMRTFGPHFSNGLQKPLFVNNTLVIGDANEHI
jgi:hypothetical protein